MGGGKVIPDPKVQAAELKKRLLQKKKQGNSTGTHTSTTAGTSPTTDASPKNHSAPRLQPQHPFRAESAEIDALIKAHSNPETPNKNTSSADHVPIDINRMLAQEGQVPGDKQSTTLGRLGRYTITNGNMTTSPITTVSTSKHADHLNSSQATDDFAGVLVNKTNTAIVNQLDIDDANDLHEWLSLTGFYDRQVRKKKLERSRKLAQFEVEEQRIRVEEAKVKADQERLTAERRKLMDEDGEEAPPTPPIAQTLQPASKTSSHAENSRRHAEKESTTKLSDEQAPLPTAPEDALQKVKYDEKDGAKDGTENEAGAKDKHANILDRSTGLRASRPSSRSKHINTGICHGRSLSRRSASPPFDRDGLRHDHDDGGYGRKYGHNSHRDDTSGEHRARSNHRGTDWYRSSSPRPSAMVYPKHVNLGGRGETRFFMVKSFTYDNVRQCMEDGIWTTHRQHEKLFSDAFLQCKNVILVFSVNQSRAFQGYARMMSPPSADVPQPYWLKFIHWETTLPFRVDWLSTVEVPFVHFSHLKNRLNEDAPVMVGKNGQEIDEECGRRLLDLMHDITQHRREDQEHNDRMDQRSPRAYRDAGGYRTGDRDGGFLQGEYNSGRQP